MYGLQIIYILMTYRQVFSIISQYIIVFKVVLKETSIGIKLPDVSTEYLRVSPTLYDFFMLRFCQFCHFSTSSVVSHYRVSVLLLFVVVVVCFFPWLCVFLGPILKQV